MRNLTYYDDVIVPDRTPRPTAQLIEEWVSKLPKFARPPIARSGSYQNKFGDVVTWEANEDGTYVAMHVGWSESDPVGEFLKK